LTRLGKLSLTETFLRRKRWGSRRLVWWIQWRECSSRRRHRVFGDSRERWLQCGSLAIHWFGSPLHCLLGPSGKEGRKEIINW
jgi:hypothetical protein